MTEPKTEKKPVKVWSEVVDDRLRDLETRLEAVEDVEKKAPKKGKG